MSPSTEHRTRRGPVLASVVLVLVAAAAVLLTTTAPAPPIAPAGTSGELVSRTVLTCPDYAAGGGVDTSVRVGLAAVQRLGSDGSVRRGPVDGDQRPVDVSRGEVVDVPRDGGPTVVSTDGLAAGLFGDRTDRRTGGTLAVTSCVAPRAQWWFTGAGAGLDHSSTLLLTNVDPGPAVIDLRVLGPDGEVETVGTTGITIPPRSQQRIELADIAPQTDDLALGVRASRGRVAASVADSRRAGASAPSGHEWIPSTDRPSRTVRLGGLPVRGGDRTLLVANPSDREAVVDLRVSGRSGAFAPAGLDPVSVAPGALVQVDLDEVLPAGEAVALRLRSRVPVVASVRVTDRGDHAYAGPVTPLPGPAAAPVLEGLQASVQLTAGAVAATASVSVYDESGQRVGGTTLPLGPGATRAWSTPRSAAYLVVTPSQGSVTGAVGYAGDGLADLPLTALPIRVQRSSVRPVVR